MNFKMIFNTKKKQRINRKTKEKYINFDSRCPRKGYPMKKKKEAVEEAGIEEAVVDELP